MNMTTQPSNLDRIGALCLIILITAGLVAFVVAAILEAVST